MSRAQGRAEKAAAAQGRAWSPGRMANILRYVVLGIGALVFLFPFYYMVVGSLQREPDTSLAGAFPNPSNITLDNYVDINGRIGLVQGLANSGIFTMGVILCTLVFGVLAGYALSVLHWRGRGTTFAILLLVQIVPFQLLMIPLYVLIARDYGLSDSYFGMILPFAINSAAVLIFRQYFLQLPQALFDAARIDGAKRAAGAVEHRAAARASGGAHGDSADLHRSVERVPLAVPDHQGGVAAAPRGVARQLHLDGGGIDEQPLGTILAGAVVLAIPPSVLFILFQRHFNSSDLGSGVKG